MNINKIEKYWNEDELVCLSKIANVQTHPCSLRAVGKNTNTRKHSLRSDMTKMLKALLKCCLSGFHLVHLQSIYLP